MPPIRMFRLAKITALVCLLSCPQTLPGQTLDQSKSQDQSEVLRVYTELVQTDVMVFDKQGRFVPGLKREDFELRIDGKPKPIEFFEKVTAGSVNEESQLAAARGSSARPNTIKSSIPLDRGRPVFFYVDDLHLDISGLKTTKQLITRFIENEMGQNDEAAITSASGTIGFLQQLTHDKAVLRAALKRISLRPYSIRDIENPPMSEYQAMLMSFDRDLTDYFIEETMRKNPGTTREMAEHSVRNRARVLLVQGANVTTNTLAGLEGLVRAAKELPGRKIVFFISGGFFLGENGSDTIDKLRRITSAAARSGVVIYSMDARGLVATLRDASSEGGFDLSGRLQRTEGGELSASQDALNALAVDTGGRTVFNTNSLGPGLSRALKETSTYYLLAWKPEREAQRANKFRRLEVKVVGKPDLTVQVRRGFFDVDPGPLAAKPTKAKKENARETADKSPVSELGKVMHAPYPKRDIPIWLSLSYVSTPARGTMLSVVMQVPSQFLSFVPTNGKDKAVLDVAGIVFNEHGKPGATFGNQITVEVPQMETANGPPDPIYGHAVYLGPGLYQVRVGARDDKSGRSGSVHGWIEVPDLSTGQLALSTLVTGVRGQPTISNASSSTQNLLAPTELRIATRFSSTDFLRFMLNIYNAARAPTNSKPDVALQVQIVRDGQPVITAPLKTVSLEGVQDLSRIPFAAEVTLAGLPSGRYLLQVTAVDRVSKKTASQQTRFDIE